ncbi:RNA 2',3'-cyclic phosphodiesterase [Candidatus Dependentiae bacterium]|nr:RNA 2',3'-cyclic phosphodiesterase [Candidatus Dependentiae bacterium]
MKKKLRIIILLAGLLLQLCCSNSVEEKTMNQNISEKNNDESGLRYSRLFKNSESIRTFIGINFDADQKKFINVLKKNIQSEVGGKFKWEPLEKFHITLKFIGETNEELLKNIIGLMKKASLKYDKFEISAGLNYGVFPGFEKPKVLWIGVTDKTKQISEIAGFFNNELDKYGVEVDEKEFHPHITIGRINKNSRLSDDEKDLIKNKVLDEKNIKIEKITLFQSIYGEYKAIFEAELR